MQCCLVKLNEEINHAQIEFHLYLSDANKRKLYNESKLRNAQSETNLGEYNWNKKTQNKTYGHTIAPLHFDAVRDTMSSCRAKKNPSHFHEQHPLNGTYCWKDGRHMEMASFVGWCCCCRQDRLQQQQQQLQ